MNALTKYCKATIDLFLPRACASCEEPLLGAEKHLCIQCLSDMPYTRTESEIGNRVERLFWGKASITSASALLHFQQGGIAQRILHQIKYRGNRALALHMGERMAIKLADSDRFDHFDMVVPVTLHKRKIRARGYNQSALLAQGLADRMKWQVRTDVIKRTVATESQTRKDRLERWENVKTVFSVTEPSLLAGSKVLIIDDVITTGATLESCVNALKSEGAESISVYAAAVA